MEAVYSSLSRHRRSTNSTSSASEEDLFTESNRLAMFVVVPILFLVYGGCACIYCCYKFRRYVRENRPLTKIVNKIKGRKEPNDDESIEIVEKNDKDKDNSNCDVNQNRAEEVVSSQSEPGPESAIKFVDYDTDLRSAMSTPGVEYKKCTSEEIHTSAQIHYKYNTEDRNTVDSGIQGDSSLTQHSDSFRKISSEVPMTVEEIENPAIISNKISYTGYNGYINYRREVSTSDVAIQTEDIPDDKPKKPKQPKKDMPSRYLEWSKSSSSVKKISLTPSSTGEHSTNKTNENHNLTKSKTTVGILGSTITESGISDVRQSDKRSEQFAKSDTKNSLSSSDSGVSVISTSGTYEGIKHNSISNMMSVGLKSRESFRASISQRQQNPILHGDLTQYIIKPWKH